MLRILTREGVKLIDKGPGCGLLGESGYAGTIARPESTRYEAPTDPEKRRMYNARRNRSRAARRAKGQS